MYSVLSHQQPPCEALSNIVQPVTRRCLCNLHTPNCGITAQHQLQVWSGFQRVLQNSNLDPKPIPRDLHHRLQRAPAQANSRQCSCTSLTSNYASFGHFSIFHYDYKRNQTTIRKIRKLQLPTCLVKD